MRGAREDCMPCRREVPLPTSYNVSSPGLILRGWGGDSTSFLGDTLPPTREAHSCQLSAASYLPVASAQKAVALGPGPLGVPAPPPSFASWVLQAQGAPPCTPGTPRGRSCQVSGGGGRCRSRWVRADGVSRPPFGTGDTNAPAGEAESGSPNGTSGGARSGSPSPQEGGQPRGPGQAWPGRKLPVPGAPLQTPGERGGREGPAPAAGQGLPGSRRRY